MACLPPLYWPEAPAGVECHPPAVCLGSDKRWCSACPIAPADRPRNHGGRRRAKYGKAAK